jgi:hypothetical protein
VERNPMNASNVGKPLPIIVVLRDINEFTQERNPMNASNVGKPFLIIVTLRDMNKFTLE